MDEKGSTKAPRVVSWQVPYSFFRNDEFSHCLVLHKTPGKYPGFNTEIRDFEPSLTLRTPKFITVSTMADISTNVWYQ